MVSEWIHTDPTDGFMLGILRRMSLLGYMAVCGEEGINTRTGVKLNTTDL